MSIKLKYSDKTGIHKGRTIFNFQFTEKATEP